MDRLILNTAVSIILLLATTGYTIFKHYCDDRLVSVSINSETVPCCDMEGGCCTTESKHFQLEDDYISTIIDFNFTDNIIIDLNLLNCAADNIKNPKNY